MRNRHRIVLASVATMLCAPSLRAQQPTGRLVYVVPPSTWRITPLVEAIGAGDTRDRNAPQYGIGSVRTGVRVGMPTWKRGLYRTVVANEFAVEQIGLSWRQDFASPTIRPLEPPPRGPDALQIVQHDLLVSQGLGPRWRVTGVLQHGFFRMQGQSLAGSYQAAGGAFVTRVYRPTLQVGFGVVALNVDPWVIPTIRLLHVGKRWRSDVLLPRAETWYDVGNGLEIGAALRFIGNQWQSDRELPPPTCNCYRQFLGRTTYTQATFGPGANFKVNDHLLLQFETGIAQRRVRVEDLTRLEQGGNTVTFTERSTRLDQTITPFARFSFRGSF